MLAALKAKWHELRDIITLGVNFCLLFSAYSTLQSYQTSVNGKAGFYSLAVLYIVYGVSALIAPAFVRAYPLKPILIISACTYVLFIGVSVWGNLVALIIAGAVVGVGASTLWTAQATYVVRKSDAKNLGRNTGTFYSLWMTAFITGFVAATIFLAIYNHPRYMFIFLGVVGALGVASMLLLREPPGTRDAVSFAFLLETVRLFAEPSMLLTAGIILYIGARGGLVWGALPARFTPKLIGYTSICFGAAEVLGGLTFGKLSDRFGRRPVLFLGYLVESCALAMAGFASKEREWAFFVTMVLFGISDSILQVIVNAVLPTLQPQRTQAAFGFKNCLSSAASSAMLFAGPYLSFDIMQLILVALLVVGITSIFIEDRFVCVIDRPKRPKPKRAATTKMVDPTSDVLAAAATAAAGISDSSAMSTTKLVPMRELGSASEKTPEEPTTTAAVASEREPTGTTSDNASSTSTNTTNTVPQSASAVSL